MSETRGKRVGWSRLSSSLGRIFVSPVFFLSFLLVTALEVGLICWLNNKNTLGIIKTLRGLDMYLLLKSLVPSLMSQPDTSYFEFRRGNVSAGQMVARNVKT